LTRSPLRALIELLRLLFGSDSGGGSGRTPRWMFAPSELTLISWNHREAPLVELDFAPAPATEELLLKCRAAPRIEDDEPEVPIWLRPQAEAGRYDVMVGKHCVGTTSSEVELWQAATQAFTNNVVADGNMWLSSDDASTQVLYMQAQFPTSTDT
jgi:hypothetical protein